MNRILKLQFLHLNVLEKNQISVYPAEKEVVSRIKRLLPHKSKKEKQIKLLKIEAQVLSAILFPKFDFVQMG